MNFGRSERTFIARLLDRCSSDYLRFLQRQTSMVLSARVPYQERVKTLWDRKTYAERDNVQSPSSPSLGDLALYENFLGDIHPDSRILLLGSTPALRRLLSRTSVRRCVVADFSYRALLSSARLTPLIDTDKEIWMKADWLDMPLPHSYFDYIVGDLVSTQILPERQELFFRKLALLLKEETGRLITRLHHCGAVPPQNEAADMIRDFFAKRQGRFAKDDLHILMFALRDLLRDGATQMTSPVSMAAELLRYPAQGESERRAVEKLVRALNERAEKGVEFVTQTEGELGSQWAKHLVTEDKRTATDYECSELFPVYCLRPRSLPGAALAS